MSMIDYSLIKNERLRTLISNSESVQSKSVDEIERFICYIAHLSDREQTSIFHILKNEEQMILQARKAKLENPALVKADLDASTQKVQALKRNFEKRVRNYQEQKEKQNSDPSAEQLLQDIA